MNRIHFWRVVAVVSFASSGLGCSATPDGGAAEEQARTERRPIVGGTPAKDYPEAALIDMNGGACSGTVIAPRVVLTAGHCVHGQSGWQVTAPYANQSASATSAVLYDYTDSSKTVNPNMHDIGLVFLDSEISLASYPAIADAGSPDGTQIVNIGRIQDGQLSNSDLFVSKPIGIEDASKYGFPYDYQAVEVIQPGDSGGPDMLAGSHTIVAVNSGAGAGTEVLARVDFLHDWIQQQIAEGDGGDSTSGGSTSGGSTSGSSTSGGDPTGDECAGFTYEGDCYGPVLLWCEAGLNVVDCAQYGLSCGWDEQQGFYSCLP